MEIEPSQSNLHRWGRIRDPSEDDVRTALSSNLCRCTGYNQMYAAIRSAIAAEQQGIAAK